MCLGFRQAVCTGFQIFERVRGYLAVRSGCTGNGICLCAIEFVVFIYYPLRFSFGCCFDQLFQLELNTTQGHVIAMFVFFRVLLDDIQSKLRVLQRVGQLNLAAAAGDGSIGVTVAGVVVAPVSLSVSLFGVAVLPVELPALSFSLLVLLQPLPLHHTYCP